MLQTLLLLTVRFALSWTADAMTYHFPDAFYGQNTK